jgi:imidazolonepropionase-like amidohydrolase
MNATIWTGRLQGSEVLNGDILIGGGILRSVGQVDLTLLSNEVEVIDAQGAFVTPG